MAVFELLERDGLARRGRLETPHGTIETPALLPVVHPDPARQPVSPTDMRSRLGVKAVITSAYITWRTPPLREIAESRGIHSLLQFDGPIMTDSGAFQQHAYGSVEVGPDEILAFQNAIGSDIATVLDRFTEPETSHEDAEAALAITLERAQAARANRTGLLAVPVQGGVHDDLRARSAAGASALADVLAVGGVVPLFEQYRFPDLARVLAAVRPQLNPGAAVHLFGTGHPMTFAFAALWGVDLLDSSAYHKFARRGSLLFPEGSIAIDDLRENVCRCFLCAEMPLTEVARKPAAEREQRIAFHNLVTSIEEIGRVRQAIREGTLWELAERRASGHPALRAGLDEARLAAQQVRVRREGVAEQFAATNFEFAALVAQIVLDATVESWESQLEDTKGKIERLGQVNLAAIGEFKETSERKEYLDRQCKDLTDALETLETAMRKIDRETRTRFQDTFDRVNTGLKEKFPRLFGGGHAYLELTGEESAVAGVSVMARPPGKRNSTISQLSGGEKALTAVALVFAIFDLNPAPFCLLDEVDAPLDENNVGRFCDIVRDMSRSVQFIFITHNKSTMEMASQLVGVTMNEPGVSRLVAVDVDEAVRMAAM